MTISPKHGQQRRTLVDNSTLWWAPPPYFPSICWRSSERWKVRVVVDRPRRCRASSVDANVDGLKNSNTHQRTAKAIFFSFDAPSSRTLKLKKASLHYFRRPPHHLKLKWLSLDSRRLLGFQSSCHATCQQRRVWPGAGGQQLGRFRRKFLFLVFSEKATRMGDEKQRK